MSDAADRNAPAMHPVDGEAAPDPAGPDEAPRPVEPAHVYEVGGILIGPADPVPEAPDDEGRAAGPGAGLQEPEAESAEAESAEAETAQTDAPEEDEPTVQMDPAPEAEEPAAEVEEPEADAPEEPEAPSEQAASEPDTAEVEDVTAEADPEPPSEPAVPVLEAALPADLDAPEPSAPVETEPAPEFLVETEPSDADRPAIEFAIARATAPQPVPEDADLDHPGLYFNRELSWIDFNWRVLHQALDDRLPLFERLRFIAITVNNLDEFYRKRVGGLKRQLGAGVRALSPDGRTPQEQLDLLREGTAPMQRTVSRAWEEVIRPEMEAQAGVHVLRYADLEAGDRAAVDEYFRDQVFPILTPLAVDPGHPFPFISNQSLSLAVTLRHPVRETEHFARLKVPSSRGRFISLPGRPRHVLALEEVIRHNVSLLFRGMEVVDVSAFRVTRNAAIYRNEDEAEDLLAMIAEEVRERRFADVVRLEVEASMPPRVRRLLAREMELDPEDVVEVGGMLDLRSLDELAAFEEPHLVHEPWEPIVPVRLRHTGETEDQADLFSIIRHGDLLVHHPYESFTATVQRFLEEAADDPHVLAIKMTLYRTSEDSPIGRALIRAAENGKQVAVLVELKARFDEENNMEWAQALENVGVHVTYGLVGLKTHAKTLLVVREEPEGLKAYCHIGTGNYNPSTARFYTDFGLLTCRPEIGRDLVNLFHYLTGYAPEQHYGTLIVAPRTMRSHFVELIEREIEHQRAHGTGRIIAKMNALDDTRMIREIYRASQEGVKFDLIVRGHSRLRPGLEGFSENVNVVSIVGRFLEHSRIYYAHNNGDPEYYIGSADWQRRNLEDRVEVITPVLEEELKSRLKRTLKFCLKDNRLAWDLDADGRYTLRTPEGGKERELHATLMRRALQRVQDDDPPWDL